jgi:hypothetical protein
LGQITASLVLCGVLLGLLTLISIYAQSRPLLRYGFLVISCLELFFFARNNLPFFDYKTYTDKMAFIQKVQTGDPGDYRVLIGNSYALSSGAKDIWGEDPVIPSRYARFLALTQHCDANNAFLQKFTFHDFPPALGLLRLRYRFGDEGETGRVGRLKLREAPRAFLANHWEVLKTDEAIEKAADRGVDSTRGVLLETNPGIEGAPGKINGPLTVRDLSSDQIEVQADIPKPGIFVMTDNYSGGWKTRALATAAQKVYRVMPANGFQIAVPLQAGKHDFILEYRPKAYEVGKWISIISLLVYLVLGFRLLRPGTLKVL